MAGLVGHTVAGYAAHPNASQEEITQNLGPDSYSGRGSRSHLGLGL